jgi:hypothetical protein
MREVERMAIPTRRRRVAAGIVLVVSVTAAIALAGVALSSGALLSSVEAGSAPRAAGTVDSPTPGENPGPEHATGARAPSVTGPSSDPSPASEAGAEVLPPPEAAAEDGLPASEPLAELVPGPAPAAAAEQGGIVDGFPDFIRVAPQTRVTTSMVTSENGRVQAALTASGTAKPSDVQAHFDEVFATNDLHAVAAPAVGGSTATAYVRGPETVTLTVTARTDGGSDYSVLAILDAAG